MSRFLFVVCPLTGHIHPAAAVSATLVGNGHDVAWVGPESVLRPVLGPGVGVYPTGVRAYRPLGEDDVRAFLDGYVIPLARFILATVDRAVREFAPDVMVVDQHAIAGALVAYRHGLRWASLVPAPMGLVEAADPRAEIEAWIRGPVADLWARAGLDLPHNGDLLSATLYSPHLLVGFTTRALLGAAALPDHAVLVGPALADRPDEPAFAWDALDSRRRLVLVTVGTLNMGVATDFYHRTALALAPLADRLQAIVVAPDHALPDPPDNVLVAPRVPVLSLMPRLDAVVCHAGMNTVAEALVHGVPIVAAPIRLDQPSNAEQVRAAGAGIRVDFERATPRQLRRAITAVLDDPSYRQAAQRVRDSFAAAGGAVAAADHLVRLANGT